LEPCAERLSGLSDRSLRERVVSLPELRAIARRQGFADLGEVYTAILETNGIVSMFREDEGGRYHPDISPHGLRIGKHRGRQQLATGAARPRLGRAPPSSRPGASGCYLVSLGWRPD
jgi:hypothetical protein